MQHSTDLPDNIKELKSIINLLSNENTQVKEENTCFKKEIIQLKERVIEGNKTILRLQEMFANIRRGVFGNKSEKIDYLQGMLFNEAESGLHDTDNLFESNSKPTLVKSHERKKTGPKPFPSDLPRIEIPHDIKDSEKICNCGHELTYIGSEESEKLKIIPPEVTVEHHVRYKYACKHCEGDSREGAGNIVVTAPYTTPQIYPGSNLTVETLVYLIVSKYMDHIPFYRMSMMLIRSNIEISRGTMCNWVIGVYKRYKHLMSFLLKHLQTGNLLGGDETPFQVHNEKGRKDTQLSYMWVFRGGLPGRVIILYLYRETRSASFMVEMLSKYKGVIQADGLETYNTHFKNNPNVILSGCMAHARRGFEKLFKQTKDPIAERILKEIAKLYIIETKIRKAEYYKDLKFDMIVSIRQSEAKPILDSLYIYLNNLIPTIPHEIGVGKPIRYMLNEWNKLIKYLDNGEIFIDNNHVENAVRPIALGRKNWLFADVPEGAEASAFYYSLLQTFKANGKNPYVSAIQFFKNLPTCNTPDDAETLFLKIMGWV